MLLRALDIQTDKIYFDLWTGYFEPPEVRGEDRVIPEKVGLWVGNRVAESREPELRGWVKGKGSTEAERTADWHDSTVSLMAVLDMTLPPGSLLIPDGYLGVSGDVELDVRTVNIMPGRILSCMSFQTWSIKLLAVDPVYWEAESS